MADRKRVLTGDASSEEVIVPWRYSPVAATMPSTSSSADTNPAPASASSRSSLPVTVMVAKVAAPMPTVSSTVATRNPNAVRVVRSLSSSELSSAVTRASTPRR